MVQLSPPSLDLYTPSPIDTLFRVQASPVPTQITCGFLGSTAIAPMDCTGCLSNTGLYVVPPFTDFHTPPLAAPTYTVRRDPSCTAARAATRPLIAAEPMLRAPRPEIVSESTFTGCCEATTRASIQGTVMAQSSLPAGCFGSGFAKRPSSIGTLASIFSNVIFCTSSLPLRRVSTEYGRYHPATSL